MKKWLIYVPVLAILFACGETEQGEEQIEFTDYKQKLSFSLGADIWKTVSSGRVSNTDRLNKDLVYKGFSQNFSDSSPEQCMVTLDNLFGPNGTDFNEKYKDEGSECLGRWISFNTYRELNDFDKIDNLDKEYLFKGFELALQDLDTMSLAMEEQQKILLEFQEGMAELAKKKWEEQWQENKAAGEKFLTENKEKKGVKVTESGLQYKVIKPGSGLKPSATDEVKVHYHGTLIDGTVFDSSVERGEPITFPVNQVIPGWTEVLQMMPKGAKYEVYIPQELAYGGNPPTPKIPPYSVLIFEIELIDFGPSGSMSAK